MVAGCAHQQKTIRFNHWVIEDESARELIVQRGDTLDIAAPDGMTLWYDQLLQGEYEISYSICMPMEGGEHDRLSDMNCFWAAHDPLYPDNLFLRSDWRNGAFKNYNSLSLFYVGFGGNDNTTTRFRRYHGEFFGIDDARIKPLLQEYTDAAHLLQPQKWYHVMIMVTTSMTTYAVNGEVIFCYPLQSGEGDGYFGLRLFHNHVLFTDFKINKLN